MIPPAHTITQGVKFDGCGSMCNMTEYAALMNATGNAFEIENCHWFAAPPALLVGPGK